MIATDRTFNSTPPQGKGLEISRSKLEGTVNSSGRVSHIQVAGKMSQGSLLPNAADFRPDVKSLGPGSSVLSGSDMIPAEVEEVIDLTVGGEEALRLAGRFKLFHLPLSSACRLV